MNERTIETRRGLKTRILEAGDGRPLVYLHGESGLFPEEPFFERLARRRRVLVVEWPGYGELGGEELLEDMLDFALHGWDVIEALELSETPSLVGHSMGGMIAAEMACLNPRGLDKLVLIAAAGLWLNEHPIPDIFATLPGELPQLLFHDPQVGGKLLTQGFDFSNVEALKDFMVRNSRRLGTAGKIMFPIPNRRVAKRLYRQTTETLVVWGRNDELMPPAYAERWVELLPSAELAWVDAAGHMLPYEQPEVVASVIEKFLG